MPHVDLYSAGAAVALRMIPADERGYRQLRSYYRQDTCRPLPVARRAAAAVPEVPMSVACPDILGPVKAEVDAAALEAQAAGAPISSAFNIVAKPTIDPGSIRAARGEVEALAAALRSIPGLAADASQAATRAKLDTGGLQADTTYPRF